VCYKHVVHFSLMKDCLTGSLCQLHINERLLNAHYKFVLHAYEQRNKLFYSVTRMMTRKLIVDHPIHTYPIHALVHHDYHKFPKMSVMGEHPL
jgi:hypothetical protein